ncbi:unnamed protein product [Mesocestoides corti]|uniref:Protein Asterix n=1 Tax=Mesocestoides corti TaxID=53468 RepID=A0A0R3UFA3_MESCO|nr:unnamed protein product [Mesocestoides corti]
MQYIDGDPRRPNKIHRLSSTISRSNGDQMVEIMNFLGMVLSIVGMMWESKWCAWIAVFCVVGTFANTKASEEIKQLVSMSLLSISVLVVCYVHNPTPLTLQI